MLIRICRHAAGAMANITAQRRINRHRRRVS
jgi:hypothetical protein